MNSKKVKKNVIIPTVKIDEYYIIFIKEFL